ncbi:Thiamine kinase [Sinobacterium norvegicum]|uniref:Thiamine kinase n=1 Tax=Sinobacterium norvegicum TaxID=1641715 RepID=A0ABM9AH60_9GAMM|nr:choline/ethanolamine kinase family protein [Sinobacterium norvegicum]CAH0992539.1 Thiamine kinase [Sinobacterium norvegicum]
MGESLLQGWQHWPLGLTEPPKILRELSGGLTNRSILFEACGQRFVLRRNAPNAEALGIDRWREQKILSVVSEAGIAPTVHYCAPDEGVLITAFIDGEHWPAASVKEAGKREQLLDLVAQVHALNIDLPTRNYRDYIETYWRQIEAAALVVPAELRETRALLLARLDGLQGNFEPVLCHHDLVPANVVAGTDGLALLDWEYAAVGWKAFDEAVLVAEWGISEDMLSSDGELAVELYGYICALWRLLQGGESE